MAAAMATPAPASAANGACASLGATKNQTSAPAVAPKRPAAACAAAIQSRMGWPPPSRAQKAGLCGLLARVKSSSRRAATRADEALPSAAIHIPLPPRDMPSHPSRTVIVLPPSPPRSQYQPQRAILSLAVVAPVLTCEPQLLGLPAVVALPSPPCRQRRIDIHGITT